MKSSGDSRVSRTIRRIVSVRRSRRGRLIGNAIRVTPGASLRRIILRELALKQRSPALSCDARSTSTIARDQGVDGIFRRRRPRPRNRARGGSAVMGPIAAALSPRGTRRPSRKFAAVLELVKVTRSIDPGRDQLAHPMGVRAARA